MNRLQCSSWLALAALVFHAAGCAGARSGPVGAPNSGEQASGALKAGSLTLLRGDWPAELKSDAEWQSAARGDTWAFLRLSERRQQLRQRIEAGGPAAAVALRAWPHAKFAWVERGVLCRVLPSYAASDWAALLVALRESAGSEAEFGEVLDPEAAGVCERTFQLLDAQVAAMSATVFDEYAATCQAFERNPRPRSP